MKKISAKKMVKIIALSVAIAYMGVFMYYWFSANIEGFTYFIVGEPNPAILIIEWILGIFSITVLLISYIKLILPSNRRIPFDPPV